MKRVAAAIGLLLTLGPAGIAHAQNHSRYELVTEYVDQLARQQAIQDDASNEMNEAKAPTNSSSAIMSAIHFSTRMQLQLATDIQNFQAYKIEGPFNGILDEVIKAYQQEIQIHQTLIEISSQFTTLTPKPDVDYGRLAAQMPQLRAELEFVNENLYKITPAFCLVLYDDKRTDNKGNIDRLVITSAQRRTLIRHIDRVFGRRLNAKEPGYRIGSAALMKTCLLSKKRKSADEP